jgi:hypothetical protein
MRYISPAGTMSRNVGVATLIERHCLRGGSFLRSKQRRSMILGVDRLLQ